MHVYSCEDDNQSETLGQAPLQMYLSVKTSAVNGNHARRPLSLLRSWANTRSVREQTFFFTDDAEQDPALLAMSGTYCCNVRSAFIFADVFLCRGRVSLD